MKHASKLIFLASLACAILSVGTRAEATVIGTTTFDGDVYTLTDDGGGLYTLTVDTDGSTATNYITAVAISLGAPSSGVTLDSYTAPGTWSYSVGGTNSGGCNGQGNAFDCAQWASGGQAVDDGSVYSWTWLITSPGIDATKDHAKAVYFDADGKFAGQMSQDLNPPTTTDNPDDITDNPDDITDTPDDVTVPEPASALLVGLGLAGAALKKRFAQPRA